MKEELKRRVNGGKATRVIYRSYYGEESSYYVNKVDDIGFTYWDEYDSEVQVKWDNPEIGRYFIEE